VNALFDIEIETMFGICVHSCRRARMGDDCDG